MNSDKINKTTHERKTTMKFGMPTLVECNDIAECAAVAKRTSLDFIEINTSFPQYLPENMDVGELRRIAKENNIFYTIHADEQLNPFDFNPVVSRCYFEVMKDIIRFAKALEIPVINMHLQKGVYVTLPGRVILLTDVYREQYLERVGEFIAMCEAEIGDSALKVAIENVDSNPFTSSQLEAMELFMKSPVFALTLDVGHEVCLGGKDSHVFAKYPDKLCHLHLHDSDGKKPHLALGDGNLDIEEKISQLKRGETCLIEVKTIEGLEKSVKYLAERGLK